MKLAIAQINSAVGDLKANAAKILAAAQSAKLQGASLLVTPELGLCGYPPEDLLLRTDFLLACDAALQDLAIQIQGITVLVGHPVHQNGALYNAASVIKNGHVLHTYFKQALPNHTVFDEVRYFTAGRDALVFEHDNIQIGLVICADVWEPEPAMQAKLAGAELLISMNASPFHIDKQTTRYEVLKERARETGLSIVYVNCVGGQDELVFDGGSFVLSGQAELTHQFIEFEETLELVEFNVEASTKLVTPINARLKPRLSLTAAVYKALSLGLKDYVHKNGFPNIVLGLSGGVDSALTLAICVDALGLDKVHAVMMPSEFTASISVDDARDMAQRVGVKYSEMAIKPLYELYLSTLKDEFKNTTFDATEENLQARIRGMLLMALSNKFGGIVVTTGNKSEMAVGYCTLYGDMAGGFALLKDVPKTLVYELCRYRNAISAVIPERIITRAPSAELRENQTDQDSLPAYEILDAIMQAYVEEDASMNDILALGFAKKDVLRVIQLIDRNEYKRRQSPIGVRITQRGFGKDRRFPITSQFKSFN